MNDLAHKLEDAQGEVDALLDEIAAVGNEKTAEEAGKAKASTRRISDEIAVVIGMGEHKDETPEDEK
ncbi:hypothetical protein KKD70_03405 [Patescibacteria group bacterium]|nr:hypothetical protein [Patescibacteria group bacterium]